MAAGTFLTLMIVLLMFNFAYVSMTADTSILLTNMALGGIIGFLVAGLLIVALMGIQVAGSGLSSVTLRIIFGFAMLLNILFRVNVEGFSIGLGLLTNVFDVFPIEFLFGIPFFMLAVMGMAMIVSFLMLVTSGTGGDM